MATSGDSAGASGRNRTSNGIVVAGDRGRARTRARRHTLLVRSLKLGLPLTCLATIGIYGSTVMRTIGWGTGLPELEIPTILPENLTMDNPNYEGFTKDGGKYWVKAKTAQQDLKNLNLIRLNEITGELTDAKKQKTKLTAARGIFDNKTNQLELNDDIDIVGDNGMTAELTHASVDTKENVIKSDQPVAVAMPAGTVTAKTMTARQKAKEYTFVDQVKTKLNPKQPDAKADAPDSQTAAQPFGSSSEPIAIDSNRLDINDVAKIATFTGNVRAVQGLGVLTTPELEVNYEGGATPGATAAAADAPSGRVKRIVAKEPVRLEQGPGQTATSQIADFDAVTKRATLEGNVVMTDLPDKRATSDRADLDQVQNTILLTGNVVVTQGSNELKGRRLTFDRNSSKMQLTAPSSGGAAGRIAARFTQSTNPQGAKPVETEQKPAGQGFAMSANFRTDPNAPVNVEADRLDVDDRLKQAVFTGAVNAKQGDVTIRSAEMTATYSGSASLASTGADAAKGGAAKLSQIKARKNVEVIGSDGNAKGDWAEFNVAANQATIGGNVVLTQGKTVLRGTKLLIDMATGESRLLSDPANDGGGTTTSSGDGSGSAWTGAATGSGRPSATFFPGEMSTQNKKKSPEAVDGWQTRQGP